MFFDDKTELKNNNCSKKVENTERLQLEHSDSFLFTAKDRPNFSHQYGFTNFRQWSLLSDQDTQGASQPLRKN